MVQHGGHRAQRQGQRRRLLQGPAPDLDPAQPAESVAGPPRLPPRQLRRQQPQADQEKCVYRRLGLRPARGAQTRGQLRLERRGSWQGTQSYKGAKLRYLFFKNICSQYIQKYFQDKKFSDAPEPKNGRDGASDGLERSLQNWANTPLPKVSSF